LSTWRINMKDIIDKIKEFFKGIPEKIKPLGEKLKSVKEKIAPAFAKAKEKTGPFGEKMVAFLKEQKRYLGVAGLFIVFVVVLIFFTGNEFNSDRIAKLNSIEVSGEDYVPDAEFEVDAYPDVNDLIKDYFDAYVVADFAMLEEIVSPLSDKEKSYITAMSQFYEQYQNIKCYTKHGLSKDSFIVSACFDIKFVNQEVTAPSMVLFYVQTNEDGELYINNLYSDFNLKYDEFAINKNVYTALIKYTTQDDYLELFNKVESDFNKLIKENNQIYQLTKRMIPATRQTWEDTVYYVESTEEEGTTEGTEVVDTTTPEPTPEPEPQPEPTPEPEPQPEPEPEPQPEPVVRKIRIKTPSSLNVRSGAGTGFSIVAEVYNGNTFTIIGEETGTDGKLWYKIQVNDTTVGYVRSDFATVIE